MDITQDLFKLAHSKLPQAGETKVYGEEIAKLLPRLGIESRSETTLPEYGIQKGSQHRCKLKTVSLNHLPEERRR